jgi:homoserine dehydrogenase
VLPFDQLQSRYFLRLKAKDQPGVLAQVTKVLGDQKISLASFLQHESQADSASVPLVLTTHLAREGAVQAALKQIDALPTITSPSVCLRIIDQPKEFA